MVHRLERSKLLRASAFYAQHRKEHWYWQGVQAPFPPALKDPNDICGNNCNYLWCYISIYLKTGWLEQGPKMQKHWPETGVT